MVGCSPIKLCIVVGKAFVLCSVLLLPSLCPMNLERRGFLLFTVSVRSALHGRHGCLECIRLVWPWEACISPCAVFNGVGWPQ